MKEIDSKRNPAHEDDGFVNREGTINKVVSQLRENPKYKSFSDEQLVIVAEAYLIEKSEEYFHNSFSGPLPPPESLNGYERILPGSATRILKMAEQNAENRLSLNNKIVESDILRSNRGQVLGFVLSIFFIVAAIGCAYLNQPFPATILGVGGFSSIVSIFVLGRK